MVNSIGSLSGARTGRCAAQPTHSRIVAAAMGIPRRPITLALHDWRSTDDRPQFSSPGRDQQQKRLD
jgi:hypothetical protein